MILVKLFLWFSMLSVMAVGGGSAVLTEMKLILQQEFSLSAAQFIHIYGLGQLAPGPNMLAVLAIGQQIDGFSGALVVGLGFFLPSSILVFIIGRIWKKLGDSEWKTAIQNALEPISIGLMCSGVYSIGHFSLNTDISWFLFVICSILLVKTKINSVLLIVSCGLIIAAVSFFQ